MITENMLGKDFGCLSQRVIYAYKCKFPDFIPIKSDTVTSEAQAEMNGFFRHVICFIYDHPDFLSPYETDVCLDDGVMSKDRPEPVAKMKSIEKKLTAFYQFLFDIGRVSKLENGRFSVEKKALKLTGDKQKKLNRIGIHTQTEMDSVILTNEDFPNSFPAWKLLTDICTATCEKDNKEMLWFRFMNAIFNQEAVSERSVYGWLLQCPEHLDTLERTLLDLGYTYGYKDGRLRVIKEYPKKQLGYFAIEFAYRRRNQLSIEFHVPYFSNLLQSYSRMDSSLQTFIFRRLKNCDACGYCTQTDKSGKRNPVAQPLENDGKCVLKCPLYPRFTCHDLNRETTEQMIKLFVRAEESAWSH